MLDPVRRLLILVSVIIFADTMLFSAIIPLIPVFADDYGLSKLEAGLLVGAYGAGAMVGGIPAGLAAGRIGPKRTVVRRARSRWRPRASPSPSSPRRPRSASPASPRGSRAQSPGRAHSPG